MQKTLYIPIDTTIDCLFECPKLVKRGDTLKLQIKVFTDGALADLTDQNIDLILYKMDNTLIEKTITSVTGGVVTAILNVQATNVAGLVTGEIQISDTNGEASSNTFTYIVLPSLADNVLEASKEDIQTLAELRALIASGEVTISQYKESVLAIGNTVEAVEALANIKAYIDTNLPALESENAEAVVNISKLKTENDKAPTLTANLKTQNDSATSNIFILTTKNTDAVTNKTNLDSSISTAGTTQTALDTSNSTANTTKTALNTSITNANTSKTALDTSKTNADASKAGLDLSIEKSNQFAETHENIENLVNQVNSNTASLLEKVQLYIGKTLPVIADREKKTMYLKITDTINSNADNITVSPTMGIKIV